jgi:photosystem II stability/assembly factor-like uncharacterized protein
MSKHREKSRLKRNQQRARQLMVGGVALVLIVSLSYVIINRSSENSNARALSRLATDDFHSLAFSPTEPETVFFGHHEGLLVSYNGGKDWLSTALTNADAMSLALPASDPQTIYAAGHEVFVKSTDGGGTWASVPANLPGLDIHAFTADPDNAGRVFAYVVGFGLFGSQDGGTNWEILSGALPASVHGLAFGEDNQTLYAAAAGAGLMQSRDGGQTWNLLGATPDEGAITALYVRESDRLYITTLGNEAGLYVSEDQGVSWASAGLHGILLAMAASPLDPDHLIAVNDQGQVFASRDGGASWTGE